MKGGDLTMSGKQFKAVLNRLQLPQNVVAKEIGVSPQHLSNFLNGRVGGLNKSKYYRLCDLLGIDI
jgi:transcriptional regulator with XRE-family HTH domain